MAAKAERSTRVLIVGAGPVGLAAAIELGSRSIPCMVIERNPRVGHAPRAKTTNVRTREHLRRWGIAAELKAASPLGAYYPSNVCFVTRLSGFPIARFENAMYCAPGRNPLYSEHAQCRPRGGADPVTSGSQTTLDLRLLSFPRRREPSVVPRGGARSAGETTLDSRPRDIGSSLA